MLPYRVRSSCRRRSSHAAELPLSPPPPGAGLRCSSSAAASLLMYRRSACTCSVRALIKVQLRMTTKCGCCTQASSASITDATRPLHIESTQQRLLLREASIHLQLTAIASASWRSLPAMRILSPPARARSARTPRRRPPGALRAGSRRQRLRWLRRAARTRPPAAAPLWDGVKGADGCDAIARPLTGS